MQAMSHESDHHEHEDIDCLEAFEHLYTYLNGELDDATARAKLEYHLEHCRVCYSRSQMEQALSERLKNSGQGKTPESLQRRMKDLLRDF
jgi:anti-sigma factor (TIGR02949 family)